VKEMEHFKARVLPFSWMKGREIDTELLRIHHGLQA
jgi:hypothetical protein